MHASVRESEDKLQPDRDGIASAKATPPAAREKRHRASGAKGINMLDFLVWLFVLPALQGTGLITKHKLAQRDDVRECSSRQCVCIPHKSELCKESSMPLKSPGLKTRHFSKS
jgi:hypothetical protein